MNTKFTETGVINDGSHVASVERRRLSFAHKFQEETQGRKALKGNLL